MNLMVSDHLWNASGLDIQEFNKQIKRVGLSEQTDEDYAAQMAAYYEQVNKLN